MKNKKLISKIASVSIAASMSMGTGTMSLAKTYDGCNSNMNTNLTYEGYLQYLKEHINIDISPENLSNYLAAHTRNCDDYMCNLGYQQFFLNNIGIYSYPTQTFSDLKNYNTSTNYDWYGCTYTLVKPHEGKNIYAYSNTMDLEEFGISGWKFNSFYNKNDYDLDAVFYEEYNTFGNDFSCDEQIVNKINSDSNIYIWTYSDVHNKTQYCTSSFKDPGIINEMLEAMGSDFKFTYNGIYTVADVLNNLKTYETILDEYDLSLDDGYKRTYVK